MLLLEMLTTKLEVYQQSDYRADWDNPSYEEMVKSLNKAHEANKVIVSALNDERRNRRWLLLILVATWTLVGYIMKFLLPWAVKGMAHH